MIPLVAIFSYMVQNEMEIEKEVLKDTGARVKFFASEEEIEKAWEDIEVLILANPEIDRKTIEKMKKCKAIIRRGIGADNIDIQAATEHNIMVCNVPDYCYSEVSDHAIGLMMALLRRIPMYRNDVKKGIWHIDSPKGLPLARGLQHMTLGLAGFGSIAREVAKKGKPLFKRVLTTDPYVSPEKAKEMGVDMVSMEELFKEADVISLHIPSIPETYHLVDKKLLSLMKPSSYLINTARGLLINEKDLYEALANKKLAGAALDVTEIEPPEPDNPLLALENIIITPHIGFYSSDSFIELRRKAVQEARRVVIGEKVIHQLNKIKI